MSHFEGFSKGKNRRAGIFMYVGVIKISFYLTFNKVIHALRGFYHNFSTKKVLVSDDFATYAT